MTAATPSLPHPTAECQFRFGSFCLLPDGTLLRDSQPVPLPPKELAILRVLISHAGRIVSAEQLRTAAWSDVHVSPDSLPRCISSLRATLDCDNCIGTVYKRGYRINLPVTRHLGGNHAPGPKFAAPRSTDPGDDFRDRTSNALRLAILPFTGAHGVPRLFSEAIAENTMFRLGRSPRAGLQLLSRDSVFTLAGRGLSAHEIGQALKADLALTGSIAALPSHFRLRAEMIQVADAVQVWVEDFLVPRVRRDHAATQMARRIASRVNHTFLPAAIMQESHPESHLDTHLRFRALPSNPLLSKAI